jgi:hypothetical protein
VRWAPAAGIVAGAVVAAMMVAIGLDHNTQCEFGCDGQWDYPYIGLLALSWFVAVSILTALVWALAARVWRVLRPR